MTIIVFYSIVAYKTTGGFCLFRRSEIEQDSEFFVFVWTSCGLSSFLETLKMLLKALVNDA